MSTAILYQIFCVYLQKVVNVSYCYSESPDFLFFVNNSNSVFVFIQFPHKFCFLCSLLYSEEMHRYVPVLLSLLFSFFILILHMRSYRGVDSSVIPLKDRCNVGIWVTFDMKTYFSTTILSLFPAKKLKTNY